MAQLTWIRAPASLLRIATCRMQAAAQGEKGGGVGVWDLGFRVQGLGFRGWGLGFRV